jgi:hypothetical protein
MTKKYTVEYNFPRKVIGISKLEIQVSFLATGNKIPESQISLCRDIGGSNCGENECRPNHEVFP